MSIFLARLLCRKHSYPHSRRLQPQGQPPPWPWSTALLHGYPSRKWLHTLLARPPWLGGWTPFVQNWCAVLFVFIDTPTPTSTHIMDSYTDATVNTTGIQRHSRGPNPSWCDPQRLFGACPVSRQHRIGCSRADALHAGLQHATGANPRAGGSCCGRCGDQPQG